MGLRTHASRLPCLLTLSLLAMTQTALASGPGPGNVAPGAEASDVSTSNLTKEERAVKVYNDGYRLVQKGDDFAAQSSNEGDKAWKESQKVYGKSLKKFESALKLNPRMHEAYTYIGYANRKIGKYGESLAAYEKALQIKTDYPPAIEYQGEAFLGLNRLDDAKANYQRLYALDQPEAHKLLRAIKQWSDKNAAQPPSGIDVDALKAWTAERELSHDPNEKKVW